MLLSWAFGDPLFAQDPGLDETYEASLSCHRNANCSEGRPWSNEIGSVVRWAPDTWQPGNASCTGTFINITSEVLTPYLIVPEHCTAALVGEVWNRYYQFRWQTPGCTNPIDAPDYEYLLGPSRVEARCPTNQGCDYILLSLLPSNVLTTNDLDVHYAGWSRLDVQPQSIVILGHPQGDVKKITIDDDPLVWTGSSWNSTPNSGGIELGSSGSPLFNSEHQYVGHVSTGPQHPPSCTVTTGGYKFFHHWDAISAGSPTLASLLDPAPSTGATSLLPTANYDLTISSETFSNQETDFGAGFFRTSESITATDNTLEDTGRFHIRARDSITITGDFLAEAGSDFLAQIDPWSPSGGSGNLRAGDVSDIIPNSGATLLYSNYPNPFYYQTTFRFSVPEESFVTLAVYDILGRHILTLMNERHDEGSVTIHWVAADSNGNPLPSGVYYYQLRVNDQTETRRTTLIN